MTNFKTFVYSLAFLATCHQISAEEESIPRAGGWQFPAFSGSFGGFQFPNLGSLPSPGSSSGFFGFPLNFFPSLGGNSAITTTSVALPETTTLPSRRKRDAEDVSEPQPDDSQHPDHQNRLFFSKFPRIVTCDSSTQGGSRCLACRQALRCLPNNVGFLTTCSGLFPYCNNGRCSRIPGAICSATTSSSSSSSSSTSTSTSSSTSSSTSTSTSTSTTVAG